MLHGDNHLSQFPGFKFEPGFLALLAERNFSDVSWHNDACPSFALDSMLIFARDMDDPDSLYSVNTLDLVDGSIIDIEPTLFLTVAELRVYLDDRISGTDTAKAENIARLVHARLKASSALAAKKHAYEQYKKAKAAWLMACAVWKRAEAQLADAEFLGAKQ